MNKNIEDFTNIELKSIAYDNLLNIEKSKQILETIQKELNKREQEENNKGNMPPVPLPPSDSKKSK